MSEAEKEAEKYTPNYENIGNAATAINFLSEFIHGIAFGRRESALRMLLQNAKDAFQRIEDEGDTLAKEEQGHLSIEKVVEEVVQICKEHAEDGCFDHESAEANALRIIKGIESSRIQQ